MSTLNLSIISNALSNQQMAINVITGNLADINSLGAKQAIPCFMSLPLKSLEDAGVVQNSQGITNPANSYLSRGSELRFISRDNSQGSLIQTNNDYDLAIKGRGYFQVTTSRGIMYTRVGSFKIADNRLLTDTNGNTLTPQILVPMDATKVEITPEGVVNATLAGQNQAVVIGNLTLSLFANEDNLKPTENGLFVPSTPTNQPIVVVPGGPEGAGVLQQGYLEGSNINSIAQITALTSSKNAYDLMIKALECVSKMLEALVK